MSVDAASMSAPCKTNNVQWEFLLELKLNIEGNFKLQLQQLLAEAVKPTAMLMHNCIFQIPCNQMLYLHVHVTCLSF